MTAPFTTEQEARVGAPDLQRDDVRVETVTDANGRQQRVWRRCERVMTRREVDEYLSPRALAQPPHPSENSMSPEAIRLECLKLACKRIDRPAEIDAGDQHGQDALALAREFTAFVLGSPANG